MLGEVVAAGDRRESLEALRDRLAAEIDAGPSARDLAGLARQLTLVLAEIAGLKGAEDDGDSLEDELERRRVEWGRRVAGA